MGGRRESTPVPASRRSVEVVCCPHCQSVDVNKRDWRAGQPFAFWKCSGCGGSWKEAAEVGGGGRRAALP